MDTRTSLCAWWGWLPLVLAVLLAGVTPRVRAQVDWHVESRPFTGATAWRPDPGAIVRDDTGRLVLSRKDIGLACLCGTFDVDLDATPSIEVVAAPGNAVWRLLVTASTAAGVEDGVVLADGQMEGACRRNVKLRTGWSGARQIRVRLVLWGWSGSDPQCLTVETVRFVADTAPEQDAGGMSGIMLARHQAARERAAAIRALHPEHPRLRYRANDTPHLHKRARTDSRPFAAAALTAADSAAAYATLPQLTVSAELAETGKWRGTPLLGLAPPPAPVLAPGRGAAPFGDAATEGSWRQLYWHMTSILVLGAALSDSPAFPEQARRWATTLARWQFWLQPGYAYFDFGTSYPLQNLCHLYDIGHSQMRPEERDEVRNAIAQLAQGLYLNALTGHGSIYNDLRGNHTAVSFCGLGTAGLTLLGEHPEAANWAALAEQFMLDAFAEHTSGAWTESPCYGNYGVSEWLRLAELLRNVTGRDHLRDPFLKRYADFSLMISDWDGRNLAYNEGGSGSRWNHWLFFCIAREWQYPAAQWLAEFDRRENPQSYMGYGDAFWWVNPSLRAVRPPGQNVGCSFADVGVNVWRSGWEDDATILLHHCGRKGQHKEANVNQFTLYACGQRLLPDGIGTAARDHNVPVIAGQGQNKWGPGQTLMYHTDTRCGYSLGDASKAYGCTAYRHVLYLREGLVCIVDDLNLNATRPTTVEFFLHPNGQTSATANVLQVEAADVVLRAAVVDANATLLPLTVREREKTRFATHDVVATRSGQGATRTVTFLRFGAKALLAGQPCRIEPAPGILDFCCGAERWRLGLAPGAISPESSTDAGLWLCRLDGLCPVVAMAVGATPDAPVSVRVGQDTVTGTGCVSWPEPATRRGRLRRWLPFRGP